MLDSSNNKSKKNTIIIIILVILVLGLGVYIAYDKILSNNNKISNSGKKQGNTEITNGDADKTNDNTKTNDNVNSNDEKTNNNYKGEGYIFSDKNTSGQNQRYKLVVVSGGERTAFNNISSENDTYYLLDMQKLGTSDDLKKIDLVSILKPATDDAIKNKMPSSSKSASGSITNLSQCNSFTVEYYEPFSNGYILQSIGLDLSKEVPIAVTYSCHTNDYQVAYNRVIYVLNVKTNKVTEFQYGNTSDFSN